MLLRLWPCCSRKGEENGNSLSPGKAMFTCCVSTQTLERVMLLYIQHTDGQSSQQGGKQLNHYVLIILLLLAGNSTQGAWRSSVGTTFPLHSCRHYKAAGSRSAPRLACSRAHCTLLSSAACLLPAKPLSLSRSKVMVRAVTQQPLPIIREKIQLHLQARASQVGFISLRRQQLLAACLCWVQQEPSTSGQNRSQLLPPSGKYSAIQKKALVFNWRKNKQTNK